MECVHISRLHCVGGRTWAEACWPGSPLRAHTACVCVCVCARPCVRHKRARRLITDVRWRWLLCSVYRTEKGDSFFLSQPPIKGGLLITRGRRPTGLTRRFFSLQAVMSWQQHPWNILSGWKCFVAKFGRLILGKKKRRPRVSSVSGCWGWRKSHLFLITYVIHYKLQLNPFWITPFFPF